MEHFKPALIIFYYFPHSIDMLCEAPCLFAQPPNVYIECLRRSAYFNQEHQLFIKLIEILY